MQLSAWRELRTGSTVPVRYLPDNPRRFVVAGQRRGGLPFAVAYVVSSVLAALALLCARSGSLAAHAAQRRARRRARS